MHKHQSSIGSPVSVYHWTWLPTGAHSSCQTYEQPSLSSWVPNYIIPLTGKWPGRAFLPTSESALRARLTNHTGWTNYRGFYWASVQHQKRDLNCPSVELVYGSPLTVPGDFIATPQGMHDSATIPPQLRDTKFAPTPTTHHGDHRTFVLSDLQSSEYISIRRDAHRTPLQRPCEGTFLV